MDESTSRTLIQEYLEKRGIEEKGRDVIAEALLANFKGNPLQVATFVDAILNERRKKTVT